MGGQPQLFVLVQKQHTQQDSKEEDVNYWVFESHEEKQKAIIGKHNQTVVCTTADTMRFS